MLNCSSRRFPNNECFKEMNEGLDTKKQQGLSRGVANGDMVPDENSALKFLIGLYGH